MGKNAGKNCKIAEIACTPVKFGHIPTRGSVERRAAKKNQILMTWQSFLDGGVPREKLKIGNFDLFDDGVKEEIEASSNSSNRV